MKIITKVTLSWFKNIWISIDWLISKRPNSGVDILKLFQLSVKNCFIRGSVVRYVQLPADECDTQLVQDAARKEAAQSKQRWPVTVKERDQRTHPRNGDSAVSSHVSGWSWWQNCDQEPVWTANCAHSLLLWLSFNWTLSHVLVCAASIFLMSS